MDNATGLEICRYLVSVKLSETADVARRDLGKPETADAIAAGVERVGEIITPFQCRSIEAEYAKKYFRSWSDVRVNFGSDAGLVPEHWDRFGSRLSIVSTYQTARQASNPLNAMLNYLYTVAAAECRLACHAMGLDPGWGFLHKDQKDREALPYDLQETVRPIVDRWVLMLVKRRTFTGMTLSRLRRVAAGYSRRWHGRSRLPDRCGSHTVAPHVEKVAAMIGATSRYSVDVSTPLTSSRKRAAQNKRPWSAPDDAMMYATMPL